MNSLRSRFTPLAMDLLSLAATTLTGACLLLAVPANREALWALLIKRVHTSPWRVGS